QDVCVQECVALAARQFDEAVAFLLVEPFDDARGRLPLRRRRACWRIVEQRGGDFGSAARPGEPWPRPMEYWLIVIEPVPARRPGVVFLVHQTQTFRCVDIREKRPSITDAGSSRQPSAKPRDSAEFAPKIRDWGPCRPDLLA